jgi:non-specific serine/threonine protein kinase
MALIGSELQGLPQVSTSLIGRDELVQRVSEMILRQGSRLVTLAGPGGIGKTRLALAVAELSKLNFADGVAFVPLAATTSAELVVNTVASALEIDGASEDSLAQQVVDHLRGQQRLLIVDNFEHVLDAAPLISWLLSNAPGLSVVVTSRSPLHLSGERVLHVPSLALPDINSGEDAREFSAVQLYLERLNQEPATLDEESLEHITAICRQLDGLPLAIELAAASGTTDLGADAWPIMGGIFVPEADQSEQRQRTMSSTVAWSYNLLSPAEQTLLRRLSGFTGGFSLEAVNGIVTALDGEEPGDLIDLLVSLIDQNLVLPLVEANGDARGSMLQTIAQFGVEEQRRNGEDRAFFAAHAAWMLDLAVRAEPELRGSDQLRWVALLDADLGNIRSAIDWFHRQDDLESALTLVSAIGWYWSSPGHFHEGRELYNRLLADSENRVTPPVRIKALESAGDIEDWLMNLPMAEARYAEAAALCRTTGDIAKLSSFSRGLGSIALGRGEFERAAQLFAESIESSSGGVDPWNHAAATNLLGSTLMAQGSFEAAIPLCMQATQEWHEMGDPGHVIAGSSTTASAALGCGQFALARERGEFTLINASQLNDRWFSARATAIAGALLIQAGREPEGIRLASAAEQVTSTIGTPIFPWIADLYRGFTDRARQSLGESEFNAHWEAGRQLTEEEAIQEALAAFASLDAQWAEEQVSRPELTPRELDVLALLAQGKTDREIGDELFIEGRTVSKHVAAILSKLDVPNRSAAASTALRLGLIEP